MNIAKNRPSRQAVLILSHGDGHIEIFGEKNIDIYLARIPHCPGSEALAEDVAELAIPRRYRDLYRADRLRATGSTRPLLPSVMARAVQAKEDIVVLNRLGADTPALEEVRKKAMVRKW
ncbi:MAG: hypothetical protein GXP26_05460 [Planctomycetes bacterium]|nr:hypothetical protein [Planctomycetota bacterium]